jgi:hypothetical protein
MATVQVADSSTPSQSATLLLSFIVNPAVTPLQITTSSLPAGGVSVAYSAAVAATGGTPPYGWSATNLPNGLSIDPITGVISGTATAVGSSSVNIMVHDGASPQQSASASLALSIISRGIIGIISENSAGKPSTGVLGVVGTLQDVVLSETGRYAAFATKPAGLISPDAKFAEVYWHDSCLGAANCNPKTILASATNANNGEGAPQEGNAQSFEPTISADGNYVGFLSQATDLDPQTAFTPKLLQIYIRKICNENGAPGCAPFTSLADRNEGDDAELKGISEYDMDANADHIVFNSNSTNVLPGAPFAGLTYVEDTTCTAKAIPFTICTPKITVVSAGSGGGPDPNLAGIGAVLSEQSALTASSRFAPAGLFTSEQIFVQGTCVFGPDNVSCLNSSPGNPPGPVMSDASVNGSGQPGRADILPPFAISATGRFLVFSDQDSLAPHSKQYTTSDVNTNIYLRDTCQAAEGPQATSVTKVCGPPSTTTVSVANDLTPADGLSSISSHAISADGRLIIFTSRASNLVPGATPPDTTNGGNRPGVFIRDTCRNAPASCTPSVVFVSADSSGAYVPPLEGDAVISADGHYCAFTAFVTINGTVTTQIVLALTGF